MVEPGMKRRLSSCAHFDAVPFRTPFSRASPVEYGQEHHDIHARTQEQGDHGFAIGLLTGAFFGAGLAIWLVPRLASELRERLSDSARSLGKRASEQYQQASARVGEAVGDLPASGPRSL